MAKFTEYELELRFPIPYFGEKAHLIVLDKNGKQLKGGNTIKKKFEARRTIEGNVKKHHSIYDIIDGFMKKDDEVFLSSSTLPEAATADKISAKYWDKENSFNGGDLTIQNGYDQIPKKMAEGIDVELQQVIEKVEYKGGHVVLTTKSGRQVTCKQTIITVPPAVINNIKFEPVLSVDK